MRKLFSLIAAVLFAGSMMAEPIIINAGDITGIESGATTNLAATVQGVQIAWEGAYYNPDNQGSIDIRIYAGKTLTLTAEENIAKVEIVGYAKKDLAPTVNAGTITVGASFAAETTKKEWEDPLIVVEGVDSKEFAITCNKQMRAYAIRLTLEGGDEPEEPVVVYNWAKAEADQVGTTLLGAAGVEISTVKIHENTDAVDGIKFGSSYVYAEGKYIAIKPAEGGFKAGDVLHAAVVFNNADDTKYAQIDLRAADGDTRIWLSDSASTINGRTSAAEPIEQTFALTSDQDSLFLGRYGNTGMFITLLKVVRGEEAPIVPLTKPEKAPATPKQAVKDVLAIYCNHYTNNNADFQISGWAGGYETLDLQGTKAAFWTGMTWECIIDPDPHTGDPHDFSAYENVHVDFWAPLPAKIKLTVEDVDGAKYKDGMKVDLKQGWNSFDFALADWTGGYDFKTMKCFVLEQYQTPEEASFEGNPFAMANLYFWNKATAEVDTLPCVIAAEDALAGQTYETKVLGYVTEIAYAWNADSKNLSFWMADTKDGGRVIEAYKCSVENEADVPAVGDLVVASGKLTKYNTTPELAAGCTVEILEKAPAYYVVGSMTGWEVKAEYQLAPKGLEYVGEFTFAKDDEFKVVKNQKETWYPDGMDNNYKITEAGDYTIRFKPEGGVEGWYEGYFIVEPKTVDTITCAKAAADALAGETYEAFVKGYVTEIAYAWSNGSMSFWMADEKDGSNVFEAYKCAIEKEEDAVRVGDLVVAHGNLTKYNSTPELAAGCTVEILERAPEVVPQNLGEKTIAEFLELKNKIDTCILTGAIDSLVNTQYGNFNIVDATGKVYVYGLKDAEGNYCFEAAGLAEGDIITIKAIYSEYNSAPQVKNAIFVRKKGQGIDNTGVETKVEKFFRNGQLIIRKNGVEYNAQGARVL